MITIIGEALVKLVPAPGSSVLCAVPGGSAFSTAVRAAARPRNRGAIVCLNVNLKPAVKSPARGRLLMDRQTDFPATQSRTQEGMRSLA